MGPTDPGNALAEGDRKLTAAREAHPDWEIHAIFAGYLAYPKGTVVLMSSDVDGIVEKIRAL